MYSRDELFLRSPERYFGVYFPRCFATREINTKITLSWALKQFVTRVHTLFSIYPHGTHLKLKAREILFAQNLYLGLNFEQNITVPKPWYLHNFEKIWPLNLSLSWVLEVYLILKHPGPGTGHDEVIQWNHFPRYWPFMGGICRSPGIPFTKASDAELWCILWCAPVIWDAMMSMWRHCN